VAIAFSIPPNGPRRVKSSFLLPFIERFITAIDTIESYSAPELSSLVKPTTSPLLESVPGLQYHYLDLYPISTCLTVLFVPAFIFSDITSLMPSDVVLKRLFAMTALTSSTPHIVLLHLERICCPDRIPLPPKPSSWSQVGDGGVCAPL
jgi:hypothetical protein